MLRKRLLCLIAVAGLLGLAMSVDAVTKTSRKYGVLELNGGYCMPVGSYDKVGNYYVTDEYGDPLEMDADQLYKNSYCLGASLGQLQNHWLLSVGFRYTRILSKDELQFTSEGITDISPRFHQYDLKLNVDYQFSDLGEARFTPYVGASLVGGITAQHTRIFGWENWSNAMLSVNFGAEFKVWKSVDGRHFVTLASANSYDLLASGNRPKYLNIGAAVKVYVRP